MYIQNQDQMNSVHKHAKHKPCQKMKGKMTQEVETFD